MNHKPNKQVPSHGPHFWFAHLLKIDSHLSWSTRAARVHVGRIQHICAKVEVCVDTRRPVNDLDADMGVRRGIVDVNIGALHLPTHGISVKQNQAKYLFIIILYYNS